MRIHLPATSIADREIDSPQGSLVIPGQLIPERSVEIDPQEILRLLDSARSASAAAYAPFSGFRVGAALKMADDPQDRIFTGSNVENSSYGATNCAERSAIFAASTAGLRRIRLLAVTMAKPAANGKWENMAVAQRSPCGLCRQVIREFAGEDTLVILDSPEPGKLCELFDPQRLLPWGFRLETSLRYGENLAPEN